ncbi:hypothetical protein D3C71_1557240 [compost metagenome]
MEGRGGASTSLARRGRHWIAAHLQELRDGADSVVPEIVQQKMAGIAKDTEPACRQGVDHRADVGQSRKLVIAAGQHEKWLAHLVQGKEGHPGVQAPEFGPDVATEVLAGSACHALQDVRRQRARGAGADALLDKIRECVDVLLEQGPGHLPV